MTADRTPVMSRLAAASAHARLQSKQTVDHRHSSYFYMAEQAIASSPSLDGAGLNSELPAAAAGHHGSTAALRAPAPPH